MMTEEECVGGGGEALLQLHLLCDPPSSCTVSVGTDLSMADISHLHAEVCELRRTVRQLEERLSQVLKLSSQVCGHDSCTLLHTSTHFCTLLHTSPVGSDVYIEVGDVI